MQNTEVNSTLLKEMNRKKILTVIDDTPSMSRVEIQSILSKNSKTITNITNGLLEDGLITSLGFSPSTGGRKRELLGIKNDYGYIIGLHLGVNILRGIITDFKYKIIAKKILIITPNESKESLLSKIKELLEYLVEENSIPIQKLLGIGFVANGTYNDETGNWIDSSNNLYWKNIPIRNYLQRIYNVPVYLERNSRSMALWEMYFGVAKNNDKIIYINLGTGISSVFINNRRLYKGAGNKAGEFGHTIVVPNGNLCTCGKNGCLEAISSGWAIIKQIKVKIRNGVESEITDLCNNDLDKLDIDMIFKAFERGDSLARDVIYTSINYLGISIANLIELDNPELIVFGGQFAKIGGLFFEKLEKQIIKFTTPILLDDVSIVISSLDDNAVALGVITRVRRPYFALDGV